MADIYFSLSDPLFPAVTSPFRICVFNSLAAQTVLVGFIGQGWKKFSLQQHFIFPALTEFPPGKFFFGAGWKIFNRKKFLQVNKGRGRKNMPKSLLVLRFVPRSHNGLGRLVPEGRAAFMGLCSKPFALPDEQAAAPYEWLWTRLRKNGG